MSAYIYYVVVDVCQSTISDKREERSKFQECSDIGGGFNKAYSKDPFNEHLLVFSASIKLNYVNSRQQLSFEL